MVDIHTHVLPGLDDGAPTLERSIAIASQAAADGVEVLVATPHIREDYDVRPEELADRAAEVDAAVREQELPVRVVPGGEVSMTRVEALDDPVLRMVSLGGRTRYVLLETPYGRVPRSFDDVVFGLHVRGFTPVIAHPERNESFRRRPERLTGLADRGALLQLTASALTGGEGRETGRFALDLVEGGHAQVIASDVHSATGRRSSLADARAALERRGLGEVAAWMTNDVPAQLIADGAPPPRPEEERPRRSLGRLLGRRGRRR
jgi:protein-tyrosine phosphatase